MPLQATPKPQRLTVARLGTRILKPQPGQASLAWTAEGGTDQTDVTVANSGGASGDAWEAVQTGTGAIKRYSAAHAHQGSLGIEFATGATATTPTVGWTTKIGTRTEVFYRLYVYFTAFPALFHRLLHVHAGASQCCSLGMNTTGLLQMLDSAGSTLTADKTTTAITLNAWNRVEFHAVLSSTAGIYEVRLYATDPEAPVNSWTDRAGPNGSKNLFGAGDTYRFGVTGSGVANVVSWWADDLSVSTSDWIGPTGVAAAAGPVPVLISQYAGRW